MPDIELRAVANRLVELCNANRHEDVSGELYAPDIVSVEAFAMPGMSREIQGLDAIAQKHAWWYGAFEVHGGSTEGPFLHGDDRFAVIFSMDVTNRETGERSQMREVATYVVAAGKIVREEFFYG